MKNGMRIDSILLTRNELRIMNAVWDEGTATVRDVWHTISSQKAIAYTTILTFMRVLERKGALAHTLSGRAFLYRPILTREQAAKNHMFDSIERYFDGCPDKLLMHVLNNRKTSP
jgi:BlaI family transcriptional regulator, penicillinase repressor